jgi:gliding motility-associated-like protein
MSISLPTRSRSRSAYCVFIFGQWEPFDRTLLVLLILLYCGVGQVNAQSCNCPFQDDCSPCAGGISRLTLKYTGSSPVVVFIRDDSDIVFWETVRPGEVFTFQGESNGRFSGNEVDIFVNGTRHAEIRTNCSLEFDPTVQYGAFTIVSARSRNGGNLCCTSNAGDTTAPVITGCPVDIEVSAAATCSAVVTWLAPETSTCNLRSFTSNRPSGTRFPIGTTQVTYTATDINNKSTSCSFNVVVRDRAAPVASKCPAQIVVKADNNCKATVTWTPPMFTDNCSAVSVTSSHISGSEFPIGTTEITYTAKDADGNQAQCKFNVVVKDETAPAIVSKPDDILVTTQASCKTAVSWTPPTFTDCGNATVTTSHMPGDEFATGSTSVTYTARDATGNVSSYTFNVTVKDIGLPVLADCPADMVVSTDDPLGEIVEWKPPVATDICSQPRVTATHAPGMQFTLGSTPVIYTATDDAGNAATCSFTVVVRLTDAALTVPQIITPDGNGDNDEWHIENIDKFDGNKVVVVDRWGSVIFSAQNYNNSNTVWKGTDSSGRLLPTGTYFFTIAVRSGETWTERKGFIELIQ